MQIQSYCQIRGVAETHQDQLKPPSDLTEPPKGDPSPVRNQSFDAPADAKLDDPLRFDSFVVMGYFTQRD